jgi:hypothetical protein
MLDFLEFSPDRKFSVMAFNKAYLYAFGSKKDAKSYLSNLIDTNNSLRREKNTIYGASILTVKEYELTIRIKELEKQIEEITNSYEKKEENEENEENEEKFVEQKSEKFDPLFSDFYKKYNSISEEDDCYGSIDFLYKELFSNIDKLGLLSRDEIETRANDFCVHFMHIKYIELRFMGIDYKTVDSHAFEEDRFRYIATAISYMTDNLSKD